MSIVSRIESIRSLLLEFTTLSEDVVNLLVNILLSMHEGQAHTKDKLEDIPDGTHTFMLNMTVRDGFSRIGRIRFSYRGVVIVTRSNFTFNFQFMVGTQPNLDQCYTSDEKTMVQRGKRCKIIFLEY